MRRVALLLVCFLSVQAWIYNPDNGHYYRFLTGEISWTKARNQAETYQGAYLATITSAEENDFIFQNVTGGRGGAWLGGSDNETEDTWKWVGDSPEAGIPFWQGQANGLPLAGRYTNWKTGDEPNNAAGVEDYLEFWDANYWNDQPDENDLPWVKGWVEEWGGRAQDFHLFGIEGSSLFPEIQNSEETLKILLVVPDTVEIYWIGIYFDSDTTGVIANVAVLPESYGHFNGTGTQSSGFVGVWQVENPLDSVMVALKLSVSLSTLAKVAVEARDLSGILGSTWWIYEPRGSDLSLTYTVNSPDPALGDVIQLIVAVTENGTVPSYGVYVVVKIPPQLTALTSTKPLSNGRWNVGTVQPGSTKVLEISVRVDSEEGCESRAWVQSSESLDVDSTPSNSMTDPGDLTEDDVGIVVINGGGGICGVRPNFEFKNGESTPVFVCDEEEQTWKTTGLSIGESISFHSTTRLLIEGNLTLSSPESLAKFTVGSMGEVGMLEISGCLVTAREELGNACSRLRRDCVD